MRRALCWGMTRKTEVIDQTTERASLVNCVCSDVGSDRSSVPYYLDCVLITFAATRVHKWSVCVCTQPQSIASHLLWQANASLPLSLRRYNKLTPFILVLFHPNSFNSITYSSIQSLYNGFLLSTTPYTYHYYTPSESSKRSSSCKSMLSSQYVIATDRKAINNPRTTSKGRHHAENELIGMHVKPNKYAFPYDVLMWEVVKLMIRPTLGTRIRHLFHLPAKSHGRNRGTHAHTRY
jgi:hypothetical protein